MFDWQTWMALAIVSLAALAIVRRVQRLLRNPSTTACSGCPQRNGDTSRIKQLPLTNIQLKP